VDRRPDDFVDNEPEEIEDEAAPIDFVAVRDTAQRIRDREARKPDTGPTETRIADDGRAVVRPKLARLPIADVIAIGKAEGGRSGEARQAG
jgi:hypothetical protein